MGEVDPNSTRTTQPRKERARRLQKISNFSLDDLQAARASILEKKKEVEEARAEKVAAASNIPKAIYLKAIQSRCDELEVSRAPAAKAKFNPMTDYVEGKHFPVDGFKENAIDILAEIDRQLDAIDATDGKSGGRAELPKPNAQLRKRLFADKDWTNADVEAYADKTVQLNNLIAARAVLLKDVPGKGKEKEGS